MCFLVYFSSKSNNTHRFVEKLGIRAVRIPLSPSDPVPAVREPYVLMTPTFADGEGRGAVPKQVIRFLNDSENRAFIRGVIAAGNTNFGKFYAYAGDVISAKCQVPYLYRFELMGTDDDIVNVKDRMDKLWKSWNA